MRSHPKNNRLEPLEFEIKAVLCQRMFQIPIVFAVLVFACMGQADTLIGAPRGECNYYKAHRQLNKAI